jgi:hypothetical protein
VVLGDPLLEDPQLSAAAGVEQEDDATPADFLRDLVLLRLLHAARTGYYADCGHPW